MVTKYVHMLYRISRVSRFWQEQKQKFRMANCPTKMEADCGRGGAINHTCDYFNSKPYFFIVIIRVDSDGNKVFVYAISNF